MDAGKRASLDSFTAAYLAGNVTLDSAATVHAAASAAAVATPPVAANAIQLNPTADLGWRMARAANRVAAPGAAAAAADVEALHDARAASAARTRASRPKRAAAPASAVASAPAPFGPQLPTAAEAAALHAERSAASVLHAPEFRSAAAASAGGVPFFVTPGADFVGTAIRGDTATSTAFHVYKWCVPLCFVYGCACILCS